MKTIKQVNADIKEVEKEIKELSEDKPLSWEKKMQNKIIFMRTVIKYLETEPRIEFVKAELDRLTDSINKLNTGFVHWCNSLKENLTNTQAKNKFETEVGIKTMNKQLKTLRYILS